MSSPRRGFTLIELVLVTVVIGILVVVSVPRFSGLEGRLQAEQVASESAQLLRYAHQRAVTEGDAVIWIWDTKLRQAYLEIEKDGERLPLQERGLKTRRLSGEQALQISLMRDGQSEKEIVFFPDGTSQTTTVTVSYQKQTYTVTVDGITSQVTFAEGTASL